MQEGAIDRLLELRKTLDFRCGDPESLKEYLDSKIQEQDFIIKSWDLIPDARARTELRRQTERILIRRENYPILPRLPPRGFTFSTSRPVPRASSSSSVSTSTRASQAPAPGPERKAKRAASPSPELEAKVSLHKVSPIDRIQLRASSCACMSFMLTFCVCCSRHARIRVARLRSHQPLKRARRLSLLPDLRRLPQAPPGHKPIRHRIRACGPRSRLSMRSICATLPTRTSSPISARRRISLARLRQRPVLRMPHLLLSTLSISPRSHRRRLRRRPA